jgi:hypothetical protein
MLIVTRLMNDHSDDGNDPLPRNYVTIRLRLRFSVRSLHVMDDHHSSKFDGLSRMDFSGIDIHQYT